MEKEFEWIFRTLEKTRKREEAYRDGKKGIQYNEDSLYYADNIRGYMRYLFERGKDLNK